MDTLKRKIEQQTVCKVLNRFQCGMYLAAYVLNTDCTYLDRILETPFLYNCQMYDFLKMKIFLIFYVISCTSNFTSFHLYLVANVFIIPLGFFTRVLLNRCNAKHWAMCVFEALVLDRVILKYPFMHKIKKKINKRTNN